ncbi:MAG: phage head closure protein [Pseudomonadota bacterium]
MKVCIGDLDQIVSIMQQTSTPDGFGGETVVWSEFAKVYAHVRAIRGSESEDRGAVRETRQYIFVIHRRSDLSGTMAIDWEGERYNIRNIKKPSPREQFMDVIVEYGVALD